MLAYEDQRKVATAYAVLVAVDGARPGATEGHPLADVLPLNDMDTRPADHIAPFHYEPRECEVCGDTPMQGSQYCSESHRKIQEGEPSVTEQMADL